MDLAFALSAGMVTAFNPCGVAMLPAFLAMLLSRQQQSGWMDGLRAGLTMMGGFVVLFGLAGLVVGTLGQTLFLMAPVVSLLVAAAFLVLAVLLWRGRAMTVSLGGLPARLQARVLRGSGWTFFWYGLSYGLVSLTCSFPVFLAVAVTGFHQSVITGLLRYVVYAVGMGLIVTALAVATVTARRAAERAVHTLMPVMHRLSAVVLLFGSSYMIWYWLGGPGSHTGLF